TPHIVIVQRSVCLQRSRIRKVIEAYRLAEKILQRTGSRKLMSSHGQVAGTAYPIDQHALDTNGCLMQIHLPVHQPPCAEEIFNTVDPFLLHHQLVVADIQHRHDTIYPDGSFLDACKEGIATQVVEPVHIELARYQGMKEFPWIAVPENLQGQVKRSVKL